MNDFWARLNPFYTKSKTVYDSYKRYLPVTFFVAGFGYDSATLRRIDQLSDNIILLFYLILLMVLISLINLVDKEVVKQMYLTKYKEWYPLATQFCLGGLFSAYVIFYFQSTDFSKSWLFLGLLVVLLVANEFLEDNLTNIYFQIALFFLASFSFLIFFLPVITKKMNHWMFVAGGFLSLLLVASVLYILYRFAALDNIEQLKRVAVMVIGMFAVLNLFYFMNWIPPVPLSLKSGGIYHSIQKSGDEYQLRYESPSWYEVFRDSDDTYHYAEGDTVFCFAAVFAPTRLQQKILHHWQTYNEQRGEWLTTDRLTYDITGGRDGGFRGYTFKRHITPGEWRVDVMTEHNLRLGRINFEIVPVDSADYELATILR